MKGSLTQKPETVETVDLFDRFDNMFEDWMRLLPFRRPAWFPRAEMAEMNEMFIPVDEFHENGNLVVRAELPGIDPEKDVELTVSGGMLHISAERREEEKKEEKGYTRQEMRYGSFARSLPLPEGVTESQIVASYKDGILEIRVPAPTPAPAKKIPISKS